MNDQLLLGITNPTYSHAAAPKDYVDSEIAKIKSSGGGADLSDYLKKTKSIFQINHIQFKETPIKLSLIILWGQ